MKISNKTLMMTISHDVQVGHNGAIEATFQHQVFLSRNKNGEIDCDLDFADIENVKFMGIPIEKGYEGFKKFKKTMLEMGINVDEIFDKKARTLITDADIDLLKGYVTWCK
tara:strand:- start:379 stop:711 length:333 start_codon:yes stop_codon:yes gene_type:complete